MLNQKINSPSRKTGDMNSACFRVKNFSNPALWYPPAL